MANTNRVKIAKEVLLWAIEESQKSLEEVKEKFNKIEEWINQDSLPTFRQLENLANLLKVPLGYMFLDKPPRTNIIESDFRTIGNKKPNISKNLKDTIYEMSRKQDWISEYRKDNGWDKIIVKSYKDLKMDDLIKEAKEFLDLKGYWYRDFKDNRKAFNFLREKLENKGIIVMQNGVVVSNTHRKLDINEFRGFMLYDDYAPLIFVNGRDSFSGRIFTLVHEFIHLLFKEDDVLENIDYEEKKVIESQVNKITIEFLIPRSHINEIWNKEDISINQIDKVSKLFNVSRLALGIRLKDLNLVNKSFVEEIRDITNKDIGHKEENTDGGDYWVTYKSRYSRKFIETVIQGAESGDISYRDAFNLLNVKAKNYDILKEDVMSYG